MSPEQMHQLACVLYLNDPAPRDDIAAAFVGALDDAAGTGHVTSEAQSVRILDGNQIIRVIEINLLSAVNHVRLRDEGLLHTIEQKSGAQVVIRPLAATSPWPVRMAVFDMDSTLIQQEVIDLLAAHAGVEDRVAAITARAMNGELDFTASLKERVSLLAGLPATVFEDLKPSITLTNGAADLMKCMQALGVKTALLSGGFMPLATHVANLLGIDHVHANQLGVENGVLTGQLVPGSEIVHSERKRELLEEIAKIEGVLDTGLVMAVGDGANDLPMLHKAGLGVALNAKPKVQKLAPCRLNSPSMLDIMYLLGYTAQEIQALCNQK